MNNPANFPNMMANPGPAQAQMGGPSPQPPNLRQHLHNIFLQQHQQQQYVGWQATVSPQERAHWVTQMVTQLRLAKRISFEETVKHCIQLETQKFLSSADKAQYTNEIEKILQMYTRLREGNASAMQHGNSMPNLQMPISNQMPGNAAMAGQGPNQFPQGFPPQLQHPMQASPIPPNNQVTVDPNLEAPGPPAAARQQQPLQQPQQNGNPFAQMDQNQVNAVARRMMTNATPEMNEKAMNFCQAMSLERQQQLREKNVDPRFLFYRQQAQNMLAAHMHKKQQAMQGQMGQQPGQGVGPAMQAPNVTPQRMSLQMNNQQGPSSTMPGAPEFDFSQFIGQQADAIRSQDAGQIVVPASNNSALTQPINNFGPLGMHQPGQVGRQGMPGSENPKMVAQQQQQLVNLQQNQKAALRNSGTQIQAQAHALARAQAAQAQAAQAQAQNQQMSLRGQVGGLNSQAPQQSPAMGLLTQPMAQPGQQGSSTPQQRPHTGVQQMPNQGPMQADARMALQQAQQAQQAQQRLAGPQQGQQPGMPPGRRQLPPELLSLPPQVQHSLMTATEDNYRAALQRLRQPQQQQPQQRPSGAQPGMTQAGQPPNSQFLQGVQQPNPMMAARNQGTAPPPQQGQQVSADAMQQQAQLQQRIHQAMQRPGRPVPQLTPEMQLQMDNRQFPTAVLNVNQSNVPEQVKTWAQLKDWMMRNPASLPPDMNMEKLNRLQALHFQHLMMARQLLPQQQQQQRQQPDMNLQQFVGQPKMSIPMPPNQPNGQAPQAQMVPPGMPQPQMQPQMGGPQIMPDGSPLPSRINVTPQDVQQWRFKAGPQGQNLNDEQVRQHIMQRKVSQFRQQQQQQQQQHFAMQRAQSMQQLQPPQQLQQQGLPQQPNNLSPQNFITQAQGQNRSQQQGQTQTMPQPKTVRPPQGADKQGQQAPPASNTTQRPPPQKGVKRPSSDDVVEIPNPNQSHPPPSVPEAPAMQPSKSQQRPTGTRQEQPVALPANQQSEQLHPSQAQAMHDRAQAQLQTNKHPSQDNMPQTSTSSMQRFQDIVNEVTRAAVKLPAIPVSQEDRQVMASKLQAAQKLLRSLDASMFYFYQKNQRRQDSITYLRGILNMRAGLLQQVNKDFSLADELSVGLEKFNQCLNKIYQFVHFVQVEKEKETSGTNAQPLAQSQASNGLPQSQQPTTTDDSVQGTQIQLNAANLLQQQKALQQQALHRRQSSKAPAAPTSAQPPFQLGAQSPHGVPQYASGLNNLTQDKLKVPPKKKQRTAQVGSAATTPAQATPGSISSPQISKPVSPEAKRQQVPEAPKAAPEPPRQLFRCQSAECEFLDSRFESQAELEQHKKIHTEITDPLKFFVESMADAFGLNPDGTPKPAPKPDVNAADRGQKPQPTATATKPAPATVKPGQAPQARQEALTPAAAAAAAPGAPPMQRVPTQPGAAAKASPATNNLLKTPQPAVKASTPGSSGPTTAAPTAKPTKPGESKKPTPASGPSAAPAPPAEPEDPWANARIKPGDLDDLFGELGSMLDGELERMLEGEWNDAFSPPLSSSLSLSAPDMTPSSSKDSHDSADGPARNSDNINEGDKLDISLDVNVMGEEGGAGAGAGVVDYNELLRSEAELYALHPQFAMDADLARDLEGLAVRGGDTLRGLAEGGRKVDLNDWEGLFGPAAGLEPGDGIPGWEDGW